MDFSAVRICLGVPTRRYKVWAPASCTLWRSATNYLKSVFAAALLLGLALATASCGPPGNDMQNRIGALPPPVKHVVQDAVYSQSVRGPYTWAQQNNLVVEMTWSDYRHGYKPENSHRIYTIDLTGQRMRIDDDTNRTVALFDGGSWRVFVGGQEIKKPSDINPETVGYAYTLESAAGEMRSLRMFLAMPFSLLDQGVTLKFMGQVAGTEGANNWNVVKATFDFGATGRLKDDQMMVYFDPGSKRVDRCLFTFADAPFYGLSHWAEWSDYRKMTNGLVLAHRYDFRMTDAQGQADLGRRLTFLVSKAACNVALPGDIFSSPSAKLPPFADQTVGAPDEKLLGPPIALPKK